LARYEDRLEYGREEHSKRLVGQGVLFRLLHQQILQFSNAYEY
jgi:hypothetical protein